MTVIKEWDGSQWQTIVVGKQGPQGNTGATGSQGSTGPQGTQGPQGPQGAPSPGDDDQYVLSLQIFS